MKKIFFLTLLTLSLTACSFGELDGLTAEEWRDEYYSIEYDYAELGSQNQNLQYDFDYLQSEYDSLESEYSSLESDYEELQSDFSYAKSCTIIWEEDSWFMCF